MSPPADANSTDLRPPISDLWSSTIFASRTARTLSPPPAPVPAGTTYTWNQSGTASWATSTNWTPTRTTPAATDILVFNNGATTTVTSVPAQTIAQLSVSGNTNVTLQAAVTATTLIIGGDTGTDLSVAAGSQLNINTTLVYTISLSTGTTGSISGAMTYTQAAHKLLAADANGITFNSGSTFTQGIGVSSTVFGTTPASSVVFASGSTFIQQAGSNPFATTVFQTGSLFSFQQNSTPSFSGRTYANFEYNTNSTNTVTGGSAVSIDNLTITQGTLDFNMTGTPGHAIKGNISVAAGATLNFNPASAGTVNLSGTSAQTISGPGTISTTLNSAIAITNAAGVSLSSGATLTVGGALTTAVTFTNSGTFNVNGTFQINQGGLASGNDFVYGASFTLVFNNSSGSYAVNGTPAFWPTTNGPPNVTVQNTGGITMSVARTVSGLFQYAKGVTNANNLTLNGTSQVNNGGFLLSGSPTYGSSSLLKYNTGGLYGRNGEWLAVTSGAGYPANVQISGNTTLDIDNSGSFNSVASQMSGNLTIDSGSALTMAAMTQPLTVLGNINNNGTLNLSSAAGGDIKVGGSFSNTGGTFTPNGRTLTFNGGSAQTWSDNNSQNFGVVVINNSSGGLSLNSAISCQTLTLTSGKVTTTSSNLLTVTNTATGAVSAGSASSYINGPLARVLPANLATGTTYVYPVGKAGFNPFELVDPTTNSGGTITIQAEEFDGSTGGSAGTGLSSINSDRYWGASITNPGNFTNTKVRLTNSSALAATNRIGKAANVTDAYASIGGTVVGSTILSDPITSFSFFVIGTAAPAALSGSVNVGTGQTYTTLTGSGGLFEAINAGGLSGNLTANITSDLSEDGTNALNQWTETGAGNYTLTIQPDSATMRTISGSVGVPLGMIRLNGADRVTIDGRFSGSGRFLTFRNTDTVRPAISLQNDASNNTIRSSVIEGASTTTTNGIIFLSTGTTTGNDNNTITDDQIRAASAGVPANLIASFGTSAAVANSNNTISNNELFNFTGTGIHVQPGGNESWTIQSNTIYQTANRTTQLRGINFGSIGTSTITQNIIHDLNSSLLGEGIEVGAGTGNVTISRNRIYSMQSVSGATGFVLGIRSFAASGSSVTVVSNQITLIPSFANAQYVSGIEDDSAAGSTFNSYFNSVLVGGTASGTNPSIACARNTPSTHTSLNNICFNNRTGGTGTHFASGTEDSGGSFTSNYNIFVGTGATPANFMDYSTTSTSTGTPVSFATWKSSTGGDANSQASNPGGAFTTAMFVDPSTGDLHIANPSINGAPASNSGTPVAGITTDYDNDTRDASNPDIGSDEFANPNVTFNGSGNLPAGNYNNVTINNCSTFVTLTGNVTITGTLTINTCANLYTNNFIVSGPGSFVLAAGGWLHITDANGITTAACGTGSTCGSIRTTTRSFSNTANYDYDGGTNQAVGNGLPSPVADLLISNTGGSGSNTVTGNAGQAAQLLQIIQGVYSSHSDYVDVDIQAAGTLSLAGDITVSGNWTNAGTFTPNGFTVAFNGTGAQTITTGGTTAGKTFAGFTVSKSSGTATLAGDLSDTALTISGGTFDQGASFNVASGAVTVSSGATWSNTGTGDLVLSGNVSNSGTITFNANGTSCGDNDDIVISSTGGQRSWSGTGTFSLTDVAVSNQGGTAVITVHSGTNSGGNGLNWFFLGCTSNAYTWTPTVLATDWQVPTNWTPTRTTPDSGDVLIFDNGASPTVTNIPTQTISKLRIINSTTPSFSAAANGNTLTITAGTGQTGFDVFGLAVTGSNALIIKLGSGTLGSVTNAMSLAGGGHALVSNDAAGITFPNGSIFSTQAGFTGNAFGDGDPGFGAAGSVIFQSGATYIHNAGGSPFGSSGNASVVTFQTGSAAQYLTGSGFDASGRTYADLVIGSNSIAVTATQTGSGASQNFQFDNLTINSTGTTSSSLLYTGLSSSSIAIHGNITSNGVGSSSLPDVTLTPGSGGLTINKSGTVTFGNDGSNTRSVNLNGNVTVTSGTTLTLSRIVQLGTVNPNSKTLSVSVGGTLNGGSTGYVIGSLLKNFTGSVHANTFQVGTPNGYSPIEVANASGTGSLTISATGNKLGSISGANALSRFWTIASSGVTQADLVFHYNAGDIPGGATESNFKFFRYNGSFTQFSPSVPIDTVNHAATLNGVTSFSDWTLAEPSAVPSLAINSTASQAEGSSGQANMPFTVNLSPASAQTVTVHYSTADGSTNPATGGATCGGSVDYVTTTGTLTFAPTETSKTINVPICGDKKVEPDETFTVTLDTPVNALITSGTSTGTITNDDHAPVANNVTDSTTENTLKTITMSSSDADGDAQTFSIVGSPSHGSLTNFGAPSCTAGNCTETVDYTPTSGYTGTDSFTYKTNDGANDSNTATVSLTISFPANLVVTKSADTDGTCIPGDCSLREAINAANADPDLNTITFNIPPNDARHFYYKDDGSGSTNGHVTPANVTATTATDDTTISDIDPDWPHSWWSIRPASALPSITAQLMIDGYSQPGASKNTQDATDNAVIRIELNGVNAGANVHGLTANALSTLQGLTINRFTGNGIALLSGSSSDFFSFSIVSGNFIGTDVSGTLAATNGLSGVYITNSGFQQIGCTVSDERNIISGNTGEGVELLGSPGNFVQGNFIGVAANGTSLLGNGGHGVEVYASGSNNTIGAFPSPTPGVHPETMSAFGCRASKAVSPATNRNNPGAGLSPAVSLSGANIIAGNTGDGVRISSASDINNVISQNSIYSNGKLGINLVGGTENASGVTANDPGDADTGPNNLQNFPVITAATTGATNTISGTLNSKPNQTFTIEFFKNVTCDPSGNGEGKTYLGSVTTATTDGNGDVAFTFNPTSLTAGDIVTATATDQDGNTSEFSQCFTVMFCPSSFNVNNNGDASDANAGDGVCATAGAVCTLRAAIQEANALTSCGTIDINFSGVASPINLGTALPSIVHNVNFNGPGANLLTVRRSGGPNFRIFNIPGGNYNVTFGGLTISGGNDTGAAGIENGSTGTVNVIDCAISGNTSSSSVGGIENGNTGTLNLKGSTINGNFAVVNGGGIVNGFTGTVNIVNSTISGNSAGGEAGGIDVNNFGVVNVINSTITGNRADSDGNSTGSGGGISSAGGGTLSLKNTIVAGNFRGASPSTTASDINGTVNSGSSDLIGDGTGMNGISNGSNGNQVGSSGSPINPLLGALMNNGGPTLTHALLYNSPAVDAGDDCVFTNTCVPSLGAALTLDQRGLSRKVDGDLTAGAHVDVGAYERQSPETRAVSNGSNVSIDLNDVRLTFPCVPSGGCGGGIANPDSSDSAAGNRIGPENGSPTVSLTVIDPSTQPAPPPGYSVGNSTSPPLPAFDVSTTSTYTPPVSICFYLPSFTDQSFFTRLKVLHREGSALVDRTTGQSFANKTVCASVTTLSPFVIGQTATPTAANGDVSGRIVDDNGNPVEGAAVRMSGTENRLTVTDAQGNYHFDNVETNGFYTVTPSRANFVFSPQQRSFSQLGLHTDAGFNAAANGEALNPLDRSEYFVRQQYLDFLNREPDEAGLNFWVNNIEACGADAQCREAKRIDTSAAFFLSIEFQQTGYLVYRTYAAAYGDLPNAPVPIKLNEFKPDTQLIGSGVVVNQTGWQQQLETNKQVYLSEFVKRARFVTAYPTTISPSEFVDKLFANARVVPAGSDRAAAINEFGAVMTSDDTAARARALRRVAESAALAQKEFDPAFVLMQYFGYLRRDPNSGADRDFSGYNFWLTKLDTFKGNFQQAEMVRAFLVSSEYRGRFPR